MNRLVEAGIGVGLSASAVLFPQKAEAAQPVDSVKTCPPILIGNIAMSICMSPNPNGEESNFEPPKITPAGQYKTQDSGEWLVGLDAGLGIVAAEMVAIGLIRRKYRKYVNPSRDKDFGRTDKKALKEEMKLVKSLDGDELAKEFFWFEREFGDLKDE